MENSMKELEISRDGKCISRIIIGDLETALPRLLPQKRIIVITEETVYGYNRDTIDRFEKIVISTCEQRKTLQTVSEIISQLIDINADRDVFLLGFGGGILTDITGFTASIFLRGVDFGFVSTTLLSQVDASIGGKNGVNFNGLKNMIGVIRQPDFVICDPRQLATLPQREFICGLAEIVKCFLICDNCFFEKMAAQTAESIRNNPTLLSELITRAIGIKAAIVAADEHESSERRKLNLGHTFGHAVEKATSNYSHGEAVAIGLSIIADISLKKGYISTAQRDTILNTLHVLSLPTGCEIPAEELLQYAMHDKKRTGDSIHLVLLKGIGDCTVEKVGLEELKSYLLG